MMDNLARNLEPEPPEGAKKPSLFVVNRSVPSSTPLRPGRAFPARQAAIWAGALLAVAVLGFFLLPRAATRPPLPVSPPPVPRFGADAASLIRAGNIRAAKAALDPLVAAHPDSRVLRLNHAYSVKELGDAAAAEGEYRAVLERFPGDAVALNNLGALYLEAGRLDEAEASLGRALAADPTYADAKINLAGVYEKKRDWSSAVKLFEELIAEPGAVPDAGKVRERLRRLRSLAVGAAAPKEKI
jgi:tetratricopeptide (TPR) repeat protein